MNNRMSVFTNGTINLGDLMKNYLYDIIFEYESGSVLSNIIGTDDFRIRARTAVLPQKDITDLSTEYLGTKLVYPGKTTMAATFDVNFDEFQDMYISKALHRWQNLIFNQGFQNDIDVGGITGGASSNFMKDYSATVRVVLYDSTLKNKLPVEYKFYYVWPKTLATVSLGMESSDKVARTCTFQYSTYELIATGE